MKIYQTFITQQQKTCISNCATAFDVGWNTGGHEYELFKYIKNDQTRSKETPWGVVSWKFTGKCQIQLTDFINFANTQFQKNYDCVFINPMIGCEAVYLNVWEQGKDTGHQGLDTIETFLKQHFDPNITSIMGNQIFTFCNYFVATDIFWDQYFNYVDTALNLLKNEAHVESETGLAYSSSANYKRNINLTLQPFVIERLFSSFLLKTKLRFTNYKHSKLNYQRKFGNILGNHLFDLSSLKNEAINDNNPTNIKKYINWRGRLLKSQYKSIIWHLDDPDTFIY